MSGTRTHKERMLAGDLYDPADAAIEAEHVAARASLEQSVDLR